jgi:NAD(P)-dependent dehydrogenase (short-subunit alcohol dehydrogenase family)
MDEHMANRTWFITGTSRGFGREWAQAALQRGDSVVGTARDASAVADLERQYPETFVSLALDVTDREQVFRTVTAANEHFGGLDIVVNNAGYGQFGMIEEISELEARQQIETNLFGALWVTQAALPFLRAKGAGHFLQVSSIGGITAFPGIGMYHASKWALEGFSQSLAQEVKGFGINVTLIEPGGFSTDWGGSSARHADRIEAYAPVYAEREERRAANVPGDPTASGQAILRVVDAPQPPLRCFFGAHVLGLAEADYHSRLDNWHLWQPIAELAQGELSPASAV